MNKFDKDEKKLLVGAAPRSNAHMRGSVHAYSDAVSSGMIMADSQIYLFTRKEWVSAQAPVAGLPVLFIAERSWAKSVAIEGSE